MKRILAFLSSLFTITPEAPKVEGEIEALCPNCPGHQVHYPYKVFWYQCTRCGNIESKENLITREHTSW